MAHCIKQMEDLNATMPIAQIPQHISELEAKKKQLSEDIEKLETKELDLNVRVRILREKSVDLGDEYQQVADLKLELKKYGLDTNDLESFAKMIKEADELGYDVHLIASKLAYWDKLEKKQTDLGLAILELEGKKEALEHKKNSSEVASNYLRTHGYSAPET
jgi:predicted RNase H-like nuclease (RuvC/YqgF family)